MKKRSYNVANGNQGLEELIENIFIEESSTEVSITDEDDIQKNISPLEIPGRVEVVLSRDNEKCNSRSDAPLQSHRKVNVQTPRWVSVSVPILTRPQEREQ